MASGTTVIIEIKGENPNFKILDLSTFDIYGHHTKFVEIVPSIGYIIYDKLEDAVDAVQGNQHRLVIDLDDNRFIMTTRIA